MARRKTTMYIDEDLLRSTKVAAARAGKNEYEVVEEALRRYLGLDVLERIWARSDLSEEEALEVAHEELHRARAERAGSEEG